MSINSSSHSTSLQAKIKELRSKAIPFNDSDLNFFLKNLEKKKKNVCKLGRTTRSSDTRNQKKKKITVKSLLKSKNLLKMREIQSRSQERCLSKHEKNEDNWERISFYTHKKVNRPSTGISLMHSTDYYRELKQERDMMESIDPNEIQYGKSVWLSSLRSNEKVDKWPYNLSESQTPKQRPRTNITKRQNYQD